MVAVPSHTVRTPARRQRSARAADPGTRAPRRCAAIELDRVAPHSPEKGVARTPIGCAGHNCGAWCQAQLEPTAESVLFMLFPALWTFWPWELACS
jgi:hypothetical protein